MAAATDIDQAMAAASLLGLDVTAPLLHAMGLKRADPATMPQTIRDVVHAQRRAFQRTGIVPDTLRFDMVAAVTAKDGEHAGRAFGRWFDNLYFDLPYQQRQWCYWLAVLETARVRLPRDKRAAIAAEYENRMDLSEIYRQIDSLKGNDLSDWDLEAYMLRDLDHDDRNMNDPFQQVMQVARLARFQGFVAWLRVQLTPEERADLQVSAARLLECLEPTEPLADINALEIGETAC